MRKVELREAGNPSRLSSEAPPKRRSAPQRQQDRHQGDSCHQRGGIPVRGGHGVFIPGIGPRLPKGQRYANATRQTKRADQKTEEYRNRVHVRRSPFLAAVRSKNPAITPRRSKTRQSATTLTRRTRFLTFIGFLKYRSAGVSFDCTCLMRRVSASCENVIQRPSASMSAILSDGLSCASIAKVPARPPACDTRARSIWTSYPTPPDVQPDGDQRAGDHVQHRRRQPSRERPPPIRCLVPHPSFPGRRNSWQVDTFSGRRAFAQLRGATRATSPLACSNPTSTCSIDVRRLRRRRHRDPHRPRSGRRVVGCDRAAPIVPGHHGQRQGAGMRPGRLPDGSRCQ